MLKLKYREKIYENLPYVVFFYSLLSWIFLVKAILGGGNWYSDDAYYKAVPPFSITFIIRQLLTATDASGYYRPIQKILFSLASLLPNQDFASYQNITITLILFGGVMLCMITSILLKSPVAGVLAGIIYVYSPSHIKPLVWVNQWYQASAAGFAAAALLFRILFHLNKLKWSRELSLVFWYGAIASNNGIHSFALTLVALDLLLARGSFWERLKVTKDHLILSAVVFIWIYLAHDPLTRANVDTSQFVDVKANFIALFDYLTSSLFHLCGDSRGWTNETPPQYERILGATIFLSSCALFFYRRILLIIPSLIIGVGLIISLHHHRWNIEYGTPLALGTGLFIGSIVWIITDDMWIKMAFARRLGRLCSLIILVTVSSALPVLFIEETKTIKGLYIRDEQLINSFISQLVAFDEKAPEGIPFNIRVTGKILTGAPVLHYFVWELRFLLEKRLVLFNQNDFRTGEGLGWIFEKGPALQEVLDKTITSIDITCDDRICTQAPGRKI